MNWNNRMHTFESIDKEVREYSSIADVQINITHSGLAVGRLHTWRPEQRSAKLRFDAKVTLVVSLAAEANWSEENVFWYALFKVLKRIDWSPI